MTSLSAPAPCTYVVYMISHGGSCYFIGTALGVRRWKSVSSQVASFSMLIHPSHNGTGNPTAHYIELWSCAILRSDLPPWNKVDIVREIDVIAVDMGVSLQMFERLLDAGAPANQIPHGSSAHNSSMTPLCVAVHSQDTVLVQALV